MSNTIDDMVGRIDEKLAHTVSDIQFIKESQSVMQSRLGNLENKVDVFIGKYDTAQQIVATEAYKNYRKNRVLIGLVAVIISVLLVVIKVI